MRPMTFVNGVMMGSAGALGVVLGVILFFRWMLVSDPTLNQTVVQSDLPLGELTRDMCIFMVVGLLALVAFLGELRMKRWRLIADWLMALALVAVVLFFFAEPADRLRDFLLLGCGGVAGALLFAAARRLGFVTRITDWLGD